MPNTEGIEGGASVVDGIEAEATETKPVESQGEQPDQNQEEKEEFTVTVGADDSDDIIEGQPAPAWLKDARQKLRDEKKRIKEVERRNKELEALVGQQQAQEATLPPKPTLEECDYETDIFEEKLEKWHQQKRSIDAAAAAKRKAEEEQTEKWNARVKAYEQSVASLKGVDFDEVEQVIQDRFNTTQQGIVVQYARNPALLFTGLTQNKKKLDELSKITDPGQFIWAVAQLESKMNVASRPAPPPPEKIPAGGSQSRAGAETDKELNRLREIAVKTGDVTPVLRYKAQLRKSL